MSGAAGPVQMGLGLLLAAGCGAAMAVQTRANGELGRVWRDPFAAALWSFGTGLLVVLVVSLAMRRGRDGVRRVVAALRSGQLQWWAISGGVVGGLFVLAQATVSPILGVALFTVGTVAGQSVGGVVIDRAGIGPGGVRPVSPTRLLGAIVMLFAVLVGAGGQAMNSSALGILIVPFVIGAAMGWQHSVNGRVRQAATTSLTATLGNFTVGTVVLAAIFGINAVLSDGSGALPTAFAAAPPWAYFGGFIGVIFIAVGAVLVQSLGVLLLSLGVVAGQVVGSLVVDQLLPAVPHALAAATVISALLTVIAVIISAIPSLWPRWLRLPGR